MDKAEGHATATRSDDWVEGLRLAYLLAVASPRRVRPKKLQRMLV